LIYNNSPFTRNDLLRTDHENRRRCQTALH